SSIKRYSRYSREEMEELSNLIDLKYLIGILNSKYASVLLSNIRGGDDHIYPEHVRNFTIPLPSELCVELYALVNKILSSKIHNLKRNTMKWENQIDQLVYKIYNLTEDEIKLIENS